MKITENPNAEVVKTVREGLERTGGYCPCRLERTPETKCMCKEFRDQIKDPQFEGFCPFDAPQVLEQVTKAECDAFVRECLRPEYFALSIIEPKKDA